MDLLGCVELHCIGLGGWLGLDWFGLGWIGQDWLQKFCGFEEKL